MIKKKITEKFGEEYQVNEETFAMGIHYLLGDHIAQRFDDYNVVLDSCCGAGFMSISLAKRVKQVIAVDVSSRNLSQAQYNAKIANVAHKIKFIHGDVLDRNVLNKIPIIDAAFLDPDWAMPGQDKKIHTAKLSNMQPPADRLFEEINKTTKNIALRLPKEVDLSELVNFPACEIEKISLEDGFKFYCAYFGGLIEKEGNTEFNASLLNKH